MLSLMVTHLFQRNATPPKCATSGGLSASLESTTPASQPVSESVTVTHPHHPLYRQQVTVVRLRQGASPDLVVRLPDGSHAAIAMHLTDYAGAPTPPSGADPLPLLDLAGLRQVVQLLDQLRAAAG